jgi:hypothetical protein
MLKAKSIGSILALLVAGVLSGCGGGMSSSTTTTSSQSQGNIFVIGTDAPLPSVVSFQVMVTGVALTNSSTSVSVLTAPQTVDFSRLDGLNALLDLTAVQAGTYTGAQFTLSSPVIGFIDTSGAKPVVNTMNGTLTTSTVNVTFATPLVLNENDLFGLKIDFRLKDSIQTTNGQINGAVNPTLTIIPVAPNTPDAEIDCFYAGVVGVNVSGGTFVVQGPHGRQFTILTNNQTQFEDGMSLSDLDTNTIVALSGNLDRVTLNLIADDIQIVSKNKFVLDGLTTFVSPSSGPATSIDEFVKAELPDTSGLPLGQISTLSLNGTEQYRIRFLHLPITQLLFNQSLMVPGQRVTVAGPLNTSTNPPGVTVKRVVLDWQGQQGTWVAGSTVIQTGNNGSFGFNDNSLAGVLFGGQVKVLTTNFTKFGGGINGLSDLSGTQPIPLRVVGLVLLDQATGKPTLVAGRVEKLGS